MSVQEEEKVLLKMKILSSFMSGFNCHTYVLFHSQKCHALTHTHTHCNFPDPDAFPSIWLLTVKIQRELLPNLLFLYLLFLNTHFFSPVPDYGRHLQKCLSENKNFPVFLTSLHSHHLQLFHTIKPQIPFLRKKKKTKHSDRHTHTHKTKNPNKTPHTLSKRFLTVIDCRLQKNKIILKEKSYR